MTICPPSLPEKICQLRTLADSDVFAWYKISKLIFFGACPERSLDHSGVARKVGVKVPLECSLVTLVAAVWGGDGTMTPRLELLPQVMTDMTDLVTFGEIGDRNFVMEAPDREHLPVPSTSWLRGTVTVHWHIYHSLVGKGYCDTVGRCCMNSDKRAKNNNGRSCVSEETHGG